MCEHYFEEREDEDGNIIGHIDPESLRPDESIFDVLFDNVVRKPQSRISSTRKPPAKPTAAKTTRRSAAKTTRRSAAKTTRRSAAKTTRRSAAKPTAAKTVFKMSSYTGGKKIRKTKKSKKSLHIKK
jgi:hypothetical protein